MYKSGKMCNQTVLQFLSALSQLKSIHIRQAWKSLQELMQTATKMINILQVLTWTWSQADQSSFPKPMLKRWQNQLSLIHFECDIDPPSPTEHCHHSLTTCIIYFITRKLIYNIITQHNSVISTQMAAVTIVIAALNHFEGIHLYLMVGYPYYIWFS